MSLSFFSISLFNDTVNMKTAKSNLHSEGPPACGTGDFGHGGMMPASPTDNYLQRVQAWGLKSRFGDLSYYLYSVFFFSFVIWAYAKHSRVGQAPPQPALNMFMLHLRGRSSSILRP